MSKVGLRDQSVRGRPKGNLCPCLSGVSTPFDEGTKSESTRGIPGLELVVWALTDPMVPGSEHLRTVNLFGSLLWIRSVPGLKRDFPV